jgi:hypothetical protein
MGQGDKMMHSATGTDSGASNTRTIHFGKVVVADDTEMDAMRIKVRIKGLDNRLSNAELPWCYPLMPKYFYVTPKSGELVRILLSDVSKPFEDRLWIGPHITQFPYLEGQQFDKGGDVSINEETIHRLSQVPSVDSIEGSDDVYPNTMSPESKDEVRLMSRGGVDIVMRKDSLLIRAGKSEKKNKSKKNKQNPAFISINFSKEGDFSGITMVGDYLNLVSHNGTPLVHSLKEGVVTEKVANDMAESLHPVPYGDELVGVLSLIIEALANGHSHSYHGESALKTPLINKLLSFDLGRIISKGVKIN